MRFNEIILWIIWTLWQNKRMVMLCCGSSCGSSTSISGVDLNLKSDKKSNKKFEYKRDDEYVTYTTKNNYAFKLVKDDKTQLWQASDENNYSRIVEVDFSGDRKTVIIRLAGNKTKVFIKDGIDYPWAEIYQDKINLRSMNIRYDEDTYFYSNVLQGSNRTFEARDGFAFNVVNEYVGTYRNEVWSTTKEKDYARKVVAEGNNKTIIYIGEGSSVSAKVFNKGSDGKWTEDTEASTEATKIYSELGSILSAPETSTPKTGIDLNIRSDTQSTDMFGCNKLGQYLTYTAKDNYAFKLVKDCDTEVWEATDSTEHSLKVEVDRLDNDSKAVIVYLYGDNKTKVFKKDGKKKPWNEIDTTRVTRKSINIDYPDETYFYKNELDNNIRTFTAKQGFTFNVVNEYIDDKMVEIWKADNESEYVNKIEVDLIDDDAKAFTVYLGDNKTKVFKKDGTNDPWNEFYTTRLNPKPVNINYLYECYFYKNELNNNVRTFTAKKGFAFNLVNEIIDDNKIVIWKTSNESEYAKKVVVEDNKVTIYIGDDGTEKLIEKGSDGKWPGATIGSTSTSSGSSGFWRKIKEWLCCKCCRSSCKSTDPNLVSTDSSAGSTSGLESNKRKSGSSIEETGESEDGTHSSGEAG
ncbi:hypothetical protein MACJ_002655 [Theileria orientalis]|uniref:SfiI-subtelomeric related protein family member n=1 Tax=Theileria orientalis TaxID=68886 RepID=A0A976QRI3_THEOR|nr:hypothetical protein MACJ_002655 [Theileria orientalis]